MPLGHPASPLALEKYEKNFADTHPLMTPKQALAETARCLYCADAPCVQACPTRIDIPAFIRKISGGNLAGAAQGILEANILGHSCARVCPTELLCEGACVLNLDKLPPIQIGRLQRYAVEPALGTTPEFLRPGPLNGLKVACVGSGPASLACAAGLARSGYAVTVFDRNRLAGGLSTHGIAAWKTRAEDALQEVELVRRLGVTFCQGVAVGQDLTFAELEGQFDAVFLGIGLGENHKLNLPGEDLAGVVDALEFIGQSKTRLLSEVEVGRRVAVIGSDRVALNAASAARCLGAEFVYLLCPGPEPATPAFPQDDDRAHRDGALFCWRTQPVRILGPQGRVSGVECVRMRPAAPEPHRPDAPGKPEAVPGSEFVLEVDQVLRATARRPLADLLRAVLGIELRDDGRILVNASHQTANPKYFAGGDCVNGGKNVVDAVAEGMTAARGIHACLGSPHPGKK